MSYRISRRQALFAASAAALAAPAAQPEVERWGVFELSLNGPEAGNPFLDVAFSAQFRHEHRLIDVAGFYDGGGVYKVRLMPDVEGEWSYTTHSNRSELDGKTGAFLCTPASAANHGPVSVRDTYHFGYADGTPYFPFGTTCYAWTHQDEALQEQTLSTLRNSPFNKLRMCVFPKWYAYNHGEPKLHPFARSASGDRDLTRFNPEFFRLLETRVGQLAALGVEADIILFHPYDRWGYANLPADVNDRYLRYLVARLSAYRNVWWSLANEWDLVKSKTLADWDRFFRIVQETDPYNHLRSIHHSREMYDHAKPWVTHASIQSDQFEKIPEWRNAFRKPIVLDECKYEGNIPRRWGDITAHEMVRRFWLGVAQGAWVGHGETYLDPNEILWWSKGGALHGESPRRIAFLRSIIESAPAPMDPAPDSYYLCLARPGQEYLYYFDYHRPAQYDFQLPAGASFRAELIDPWQMKITPLSGRFTGKAALALPGVPFLAVRFRRA
ncbi:MAG TPA: DUF5060 domain-containing protein [Bryobacteraceae bacterium]|nr:DUF5060 domain-containing protein [Bryobacteraceae bacterium]